MPKYSWMCLYRHNSEYASGPKYPKILNMAKSWIWQGFQYASVTQGSEYARIWPDRVLNISWVLNTPRFWIGHSSEYASVTHDSTYPTMWLIYWMEHKYAWMSEFTVIDRVLNMFHKIHRARSYCKLIITYSEPGQRFKMERFGKIILVFNYFCKEFHFKSLWELYVSGFKYVIVLNICKFP